MEVSLGFLCFLHTLTSQEGDTASGQKKFWGANHMKDAESFMKSHPHNTCWMVTGLKGVNKDLKYSSSNTDLDVEVVTKTVLKTLDEQKAKLLPLRPAPLIV